MEVLKSSLKIFGAAAVTLGLVATSIAAGSYSLAESGRVIPGVAAFGSPLEGLTKEETENFFEKIAAERLPADTVTLKYGEQTWIFSPAELHIKAATEQAAAEAYNLGRGKSFWENLKEQVLVGLNGRFITLGAVFDGDALNTKLVQIAAQLRREPANAFVSLDYNGQVFRTNGIIGKNLKIEPIAEELAPKITALKTPIILEIAPDDIMPFVTDADIATIDSILASYTTYFSPGDRGDNIAIAASHLNGVLVKSAAVFSFNTAVGRRTRDAGYKDAGVFIDGRLEQDVGGGVCQVSSTLYNAILLAGLNSTMRTPHYYPSLYCPPGRDATVADGLLDFQFQNPYPHNVYLQSSVNDNSLTVFVLGTWADLNGNSIYLENEGTRLHPDVYRVYAKDGAIVWREYLHTDAYRSPAEMHND